MRKIIFLIIPLLLTSCTVKQSNKTPHDILLSIKNYSCKMTISYFSNKNTNEYSANQTYSVNGNYLMDFFNNDFKISYNIENLTIGTKFSNTPITFFQYPELNKNPLFLSYFINTYFNLEDTNSLVYTTNSIKFDLPNYTDYLYSAKLIFKDNLPDTLTYFDKNGNIKVNIKYNEFNSIA